MNVRRLSWKVSPHADKNVPFAVAGQTAALFEEQAPDLLPFAPLSRNWTSKFTEQSNWMAVRMTDAPSAQMPTVGAFSSDDLATLHAIAERFGATMSHQDLARELGTEWFGPQRFTYFGPYGDAHADFTDLSQHLVAWLNAFALPHMLKLNEEQRLAGTPQAPRDQTERNPVGTLGRRN